MVARRPPPSIPAGVAAASRRAAPHRSERPATCSMCDRPPVAMFEFRVRQRPVTVWICDTPHRARSLGAALDLGADDAEAIALEIATHLRVWAVEEESGLR